MTNVSSFTFTGIYEPRISVSGHGGPPGEAVLLKNNPKRIELLRDITGWSEFEEGSLNLIVVASVVKILGHLRELYFEHPSLIQYPEGATNWAEIRGGYLYYSAEFTSSDDKQDILIRRAKEWPQEYIVEAYAEVKLEEKFKLNQNNVVTVTVRDAD